MDTLLPVAPKVRRHARGLRVVASLLALLLAAPLAFAGNGADGKAVAPIIAQIDAGHFKAADAAITGALAQPGLSADTRNALAFQRERMRRILLDFTLSADEVKARVRKQIPDLGDAEFAKWNAAGLFEHQVIDGRTLYFKRSPGNLFRLSPEAVARRAVQTPIGDGPMEALNDHQRAIYKTALAEHRSSVLPRRLRMTQTLTVDADAVPAGETVRAWIPYPRAVPGQQEDIRYVASVPAQHRIAPESAMQRTVYLEKPAVAGQKTVFSVTYELTLSAQYHAIDPDRVQAETITPELAPFVAERAPHIVFTDAMRKFSHDAVGDEKNPYRIAQKLFAAVDKIPWAGAREYSTISNISDYALHAGHADCGQQTLLLMTLLRLNGIPTRWQSGMVYSDDGSGYSNIHDWGYLYLAPYGWVPMDVTTGRLQPGPGDDKSLEWFYLGGLDNYRIAFNDDYGRRFQPSKRHFRSDDVDSQRGEAEWRGGNIYFDQLGYDFDWQVLPATHGRSGK
ncbi:MULTISPECIES: transglutaminase domain-containing protein [unclassified Rhodanobacter]|uniref:transglutaminase-like domain-containing protein n=1 Tax=unclassified Rhodanobacter TaxID=2621553 RepID=UPI001BDE097C|nr:MULTISPECIES: transglutaminase domain-containing protein [unclassified Rhodanobacter]MBT2143614.1 transglutaminase domain-containing protein [Rhodanobacter sp. LX-99]MBT2147312.1 transglutaminase domain-containing protein [Rhodanobacter sp. LX-100]